MICLHCHSNSQIFSLCANATEVIVPIFSLNDYFHRKYYKKVFGVTCNEQSDPNTSGKYELEMNERTEKSTLLMKCPFDSFAVEFSGEKELSVAQDTILGHLSICTEF